MQPATTPVHSRLNPNVGRHARLPFARRLAAELAVCSGGTTTGSSPMFKNVASQKITLLAIDTSTNAPKTGDAANITAYVSKDDGAVTVLGDTTATELDATNA